MSARVVLSEEGADRVHFVPKLFVRRSILVMVFVVVVLGVFTPVVSAQTRGPEVVPQQLRIRAFGDGVTAGFGVDDSGAILPVSDRSGCSSVWIGDGSATTAGTRCSSNGTNGPNTPPDEVAFSADFGLANGASWAAQVARSLGTVDFANYAVSGSSLVSWLNLPADDDAPAEGAQHELLEWIERDDPDIVLATLGGELLLQQSSNAVGLCGVFRNSEIDNTAFFDCVNRILAKQLVKQRLMAIAFDVLAHTQNAKLLFAVYQPASPTFGPLLPWQQSALANAVNTQIESAVTGVRESGAAWADRIEIVFPPLRVEQCSQVAVAGPLFRSTMWFLLGCSEITAAFTPVSAGTVPMPAQQKVMARSTVDLLRGRGWV